MEGLRLGAADGRTEGLVEEGTVVGEAVGIEVGMTDGLEVRALEGVMVGVLRMGLLVGTVVGPADEGTEVVFTEGLTVVVRDGLTVGEAPLLGEVEGMVVGTAEGEAVGGLVGPADATLPVGSVVGTRLLGTAVCGMTEGVVDGVFVGAVEGAREDGRADGPFVLGVSTPPAFPAEGMKEGWLLLGLTVGGAVGPEVLLLRTSHVFLRCSETT